MELPRIANDMSRQRRRKQIIHVFNFGDASRIAVFFCSRAALQAAAQLRVDPLARNRTRRPSKYRVKLSTVSEP